MKRKMSMKMCGFKNSSIIGTKNFEEILQLLLVVELFDRRAVDLNSDLAELLNI